jgi:hypothetical protein
VSEQLMVDSDRDRHGRKHYICWYFSEEGEAGATLGDVVYTEAQVKNAPAEAWEARAASFAASKTEGVEKDSEGYFWQSKKAANNALRAIKTTLKAGHRKPWPHWATKAAAAGWTAPKGWKP